MISFLKNIFILMMVTCLFSPQTVFAHASLIKASPAPGTHLDKSPNQVILTFNERLENELFYIKVLNQNGKSVTANTAIMDQQQSEIRLSLPELQDGLYTVSYKVISADGHPISESYVFMVGKNVASNHQIDDPSHHHQHEVSSQIGLMQVITYISRIIYFLALLLLVGWTFWGMLIRFRSQEQQTHYRLWSLNLQRLFMLSILFMIILHLPDYLDPFAFRDFASLLFGTSIGISWVSSLSLALISFVILNRSKWVDFAWIILLLTAKSLSGHAMAFEPAFRTVALDIIHLFAASIWVGGLFYMLVHWRKYKEAASDLLPKFSNYALVSMMILTISGVLSTLIYLPRLKYILYTQWGLFLIAKCMLVILVIVTGAVLRYLMKRKRQNLGRLLKVDFILMLLIVMIVSIFTYLNPQPVNQPLYWHVMGKTVHMTTKITPNAPGNNTFLVTVWMPEESGKPKAVQLIFKYQDDKDVAPIVVPLDEASVDESPNFLEFKPYNFQTEGPYLPFAGRWMAEVRVMDANDNETVYQKEMMIY